MLRPSGAPVDKTTIREELATGEVEGLAIARYNKDGKQKQGMKCIYDWFYESKQIAITVEAAFSKYPKYPPGSIVDVLAKQKCGE